MSEPGDRVAQASRVAWEGLPAQTPFPGVQFRRVDLGHMTVVRYELQAGSRYPPHEHPEEQVLLIVKGSVHFSFGEDVLLLQEGDMAYVPSGIVHGAETKEQGCTFYNFVAPRRQ